jgi:hypothetical protein
MTTEGHTLDGKASICRDVASYVSTARISLESREGINRTCSLLNNTMGNFVSKVKSEVSGA